LKVIIQVNQNVQNIGGGNNFVTSLFDIDVLSLERPTVDKFVSAYIQVARQVIKEISLNELLAYEAQQPVFRINMEYLDGGEIINSQFDTPLISIYTTDDVEWRTSAHKLYLTVSEKWLELYDEHYVKGIEKYKGMGRKAS
jgi:hypothetical protein